MCRPRPGCTVAIVRLLRSHPLGISSVDWLVAVALSVVGLVEVWLLDAGTAPRGAASVGVLATTLPLAVRRRYPLVAVAVVLAGLSASYALHDVSSDDDLYTPAVAMLLAAYSAGAHIRGRAALAGALITLAFPLVITLSDRDGLSAENFGFFAFFVGTPYVAGIAIARRRAREAALTRHAFRLDRQREEAAEAAVREERARVARELHDVVAHAVSVIVVQAQGGARMVRVEPAEAEEAFAAIERTGRQALSEMRRLLGMLRAADERTALAPLPGVEHLGELIQGVRSAGLPVDLQVQGAVTALPAGVDVSAYRIVQEALTNALKHAGPAHAHVRLRYLAGAVELEVSDDGAGNVGRSEGGGHGLIGMRERVSVYGGHLEAGERPSGGYLIRARLPFEPAGRSLVRDERDPRPAR